MEWAIEQNSIKDLQNFTTGCQLNINSLSPK